MFNLAKNSINNLSSWIFENGYCGWDPYDVKGSALYSRNFYSQELQNLLIRRGLDVISELMPLTIRRVMNLEKQINAKGLGLLLNAYGNMFEKEKEERYFEQSVKIVAWLMNNSCKKFPGYSWGYPFDWNSAIFIPKNTPSAIASVTVGDGFLKWYEITGDDRYLEMCNNICLFLIRALNIYRKDEESLCFSYTPIDTFKVHNINLLVANYLTKIGSLVGERKYIDLGIKAANFSIAEQNEDGSIFYWAKEHKEQKKHLDVYHSGFEIRALHGIFKNTGIECFEYSYKKYLGFFLEKYFLPEHIKRMPDRIYPIDIHGCAEAINCLATLYVDNPYVGRYLDFAVEYTIKKMQMPAGWYLYRIHKLPPIEVKIPYLRWGQAWMMKALSEYLLLEERGGRLT